MSNPNAPFIGTTALGSMVLGQLAFVVFRFLGGGLSELKSLRITEGSLIAEPSIQLLLAGALGLSAFVVGRTLAAELRNLLHRVSLEVWIRNGKEGPGPAWC